MVFLVAFMVHLDCPLRLMESLAFTPKLPWRKPFPDHTTIYRALKTVPKEYLEKLLADTAESSISFRVEPT